MHFSDHLFGIPVRRLKVTWQIFIIIMCAAQWAATVLQPQELTLPHWRSANLRHVILCQKLAVLMNCCALRDAQAHAARRQLGRAPPEEIRQPQPKRSAEGRDAQRAGRHYQPQPGRFAEAREGAKSRHAGERAPSCEDGGHRNQCRQCRAQRGLCSQSREACVRIRRASNACVGKGVSWR